MKGYINGNIRMLYLILTIKELVILIKANDFLIDNLCLDVINMPLNVLAVFLILNH